jgi:hypothetical protein
MNRGNFRIAIVAAVAAFGLLLLVALSCTHTMAGGGSEAGNGIVSGSIIDENGYPACSTIVMVVPAGYDPVTDRPLPDSSIATTDSNGDYQCKVPRAGLYNILAVNKNNGMRTLIRDIAVASTVPRIPVGILDRPGRVRITLIDSANIADGYFFVPGTTVAVFPAAANGFALLDSVPAVLVPSVNYSVRSSEGPARRIRDSVRVKAGVTTTILFSSLKYSRNLYLNTTLSGANITASVYKFPVLIRLTKSNFQFDQARADGRDLRFVKSDNTPLSFEVASWDSAQAQAEIWVAVDTVYGYDSTHYMTMLWGASTRSAAGISNSAAVFDTSAGFKAVWHFDGNCNDATYGRRNGAAYGATDTIGMIGSAKKFHGSDSIRVLGLMDQLPTLTLSAWAQLDVDGTSGAEVISIGDDVLLRMDDSRGGNYGTMGSMHYSVDSTWADVVTGQFLVQSGWHHLAFTCDTAGHVQSTYIDGVLSGSQNSTNRISYMGLGINTLIGAHGNGKIIYSFAGRIDEVRVCSVARSADWIRLCYMNQKQNDALVMFR